MSLMENNSGNEAENRPLETDSTDVTSEKGVRASDVEHLTRATSKRGRKIGAAVAAVVVAGGATGVALLSTGGKSNKNRSATAPPQTIHKSSNSNPSTSDTTASSTGSTHTTVTNSTAVNFNVFAPQSGNPDFSHVNPSNNLCNYQPLEDAIRMVFEDQSTPMPKGQKIDCIATNESSGNFVDMKYEFSTTNPGLAQGSPDTIPYTIGFLIIDQTKSAPLTLNTLLNTPNTQPIPPIEGQYCAAGESSEKIACYAGAKAIIEEIDNDQQPQIEVISGSKPSSWLQYEAMKGIGVGNI